MRVLIIEDELFTAQRLESLVKEYDSSYEICGMLVSVEESLEWLQNNTMPDVIFQDIALSDGNCFEIYEQFNVTAPVIFTTAFSQYALQSFNINTIDYLVKPYDDGDVKRVLDKLNTFSDMFKSPDLSILKDIVDKKENVYKKRFLVKVGDNYNSLQVKDLAYIVTIDGVLFGLMFDGNKHPLDQSLSELEKQLDPVNFFRINRKMIVNIESIGKMSSWFSGRMKLKLTPAFDSEVVVSRERVKEFKNWLDS